MRTSTKEVRNVLIHSISRHTEHSDVPQQLHDISVDEFHKLENCSLRLLQVSESALKQNFPNLSGSLAGKQLTTPATRIRTQSGQGAARGVVT